MKIPKWFDNWLLKQKNKHGIRTIGVRFFWEIMCWRAYTMGKRNGLALAEERYYEATRMDHDVNP